MSSELTRLAETLTPKQARLLALIAAMPMGACNKETCPDTIDVTKDEKDSDGEKLTSGAVLEKNGIIVTRQCPYCPLKHGALTSLGSAVLVEYRLITEPKEPHEIEFAEMVGILRDLDHEECHQLAIDTHTGRVMVDGLVRGHVAAETLLAAVREKKAVAS